MKLEDDIIQNCENAIDFLKKDLDLSQENFIIMGLNTKNKIVFTKTLFKGSINECIIDLKLIFREILINSCNGFIIGHNHPSGDLTPSEPDLKISRNIKDASEILGIRYLDNIIFDDEKYVSFYDEDLL